MSWRSLLRALIVTALVLVFLYCLLAIVVTCPVVARGGRTETAMEVSVERLRRDVARLCTEFTPRS